MPVVAATADLRWGDPKQAFRVAARLDQPQFAAGEPVRLGLWIKNDSSEPAPWTTDHAYLVEVYDSRGKPIEPTAMWSSVLTNLGDWKYSGGYENFFQSEYAAGEIKRQFNFPLHLMFDLSVEGRYEARVVRLKSYSNSCPLPGESLLSFEIRTMTAATEPERISRPLSNKVVWGEAANGWQLGVSVLSERAPIGWGESIRLRIDLKNVSQESREVEHGPFFALHRMQMEGIREWKKREGRELRTHREAFTSPLTRYGRSLMEESESGSLKQVTVKQATVQPGQSLTQDLFLSCCYDMSHGGEHNLTVERLIPTGAGLQILKAPQVSIMLEKAGQIPVH